MKSIDNVTGLSPGLTRLGRLYRHIGRTREIGVVLIKFGIDDLLIRVGLTDLLASARKLVGLVVPVTDLSRPKRLRLAMEELGVVFVKLGQYLSTRDDLIPEAYLKEFSLLQNEVQPVPFEAIEKDLAALLESGELKSISPVPMAAASVGQVHEARLADGREVVIKVRRPGIARQVNTDLEILMELTELVEKHLPGLASARPVDLMKEFGQGLISELNYSKEALNIERFGRFYAERPMVKIPKLYRSLCTERALVMEKVCGLKFNDLEAIDKAGYNRVELARMGAEIILEQIMLFGYFHGDPHPGNLLVQPGPKVALLDFGLVGHLPRRSRDILMDLLIGAARRNPRAAVKALLKLSVYEIEPDRERLEVEMDLFLEAHVGRSLKEINLGRTLNDMMQIATQHQLAIPTDLMLLVKALSQAEGLGSRLDPNFDIIKVVEPFIKRLYRRRFKPSYWIKRFSALWDDLGDLAEELPKDLKPMLNMMRSGSIKVDFTMEGLGELQNSLERSSYRLSFAVVLGALVIGSSVVIHSQMPPKVFGLPLLGLLGFLGAAIVGFWLLYDFLKNRRF